MPQTLSDEQRAQRIGRLERLARLLDTSFTIPGTRFTFGLDPIIGLVPAIGDVITTLLSAYIVYEAHALGFPKSTILRMVINVILDFLIGLIPLLGDLFDFAFKANQRNLRLMGIGGSKSRDPLRNGSRS